MFGRFLKRPLDILFCAGCLLCAVTPIIGAPELPDRSQPILLSNGDYLLTGGNWKVQSASLVNDSLKLIGDLKYDDRAWMPATVPGSVLTSYVDDGAVPDPMYGNQMMTISDAFFTDNDFWYRDTFFVPSTYKGRHIWLNFNGINWKADVYVNGTLVGNIAGAFIRTHFDITSLITPGRSCTLAVLIHRNANPGPPKPKTLAHMPHNGGVMGLDSPTFLASQGWNWMPAIPGRDDGIWNDVYLSSTGEVSLVDPFITSTLPLPQLYPAYIDIKLGLANHSSLPETGTLIGTMGDLSFTEPVTLGGGETRSVNLDAATFPQLAIQNPELWWPNGMGPQNLYHLTLTFKIRNEVSDSKTITFGIRQFSYDLQKKSQSDAGVLSLSVNGKRILVRGGNWGMDEAMLRYNPAKYDIAVRLHKEMNLNMIRNWIGMVGNDAFFDACDKYGILVWNDFWIANPADGPDPADHALFMANAVDRIKAIRNHASLIVYCGRNEGYPPADIDSALRQATDTLDGERYYVSSSADPPVSGRGPYVLQSPDWYFRNAGDSLHTELGIVSAPTADSMRAMFPLADQWPIDDCWGLHDFCNDGYSDRARLYVQKIDSEYGTATGLDDFCRKAQMLNLETSTAMCEANQDRQGSGMMIWLTHPAWPSLTCQTYDYYFEPTASYFGIKKASAPVHIFWNRATGEVRVANDTNDAITDDVAEAAIYDFSGKQIWSDSASVTAPSETAVTAFTLQRPASVDGIYFVKLKLTSDNNLADDNFYWANSSGYDYTALGKLPAVQLTAAPCAVTNWYPADTYTIHTSLTNNSSTVALAVHLEVRDRRDNSRVLPVYYGDNYFSLLPGETRIVMIEVPKKSEDISVDVANTYVAVDGWNITPEKLQLTTIFGEGPIPRPAPNDEVSPEGD